MGQGTKRLCWRKKIVFNAVMLLGVWVLIEAASFFALWLCFGSPSHLAEQRRAAAAQDPFKPGGQLAVPTVIHPYIGAVQQPVDDGGRLSIDDKYRITEFGFVDEGPPIHQRSPERVIVGILGGSVARQLSLNATDVLADELGKSREFTGKNFQFVRLAGNGYKQPQQLMIVTYLLTLGADFDILINLDGVNEAALPAIDNVPSGVFSAYPRDWGQMIAGTASPEFTRMAGYVSYLRRRQRDEAVWFSAFPWNYLPTAQLAWAFGKGRTDHAIVSQLETMQQFSKKEQTYCSSGPPEHFKSDDEMYDHCVDLWARPSILLQDLCAAKGIRYFHFLQPNQYVKDSKPIGPEEARVAVDEEYPISFGVKACFPRMQVAASRLKSAGVRFSDLTRVFAEHPEPIYKDNCCHVLPAGDVIMAKAIAATILQDDAQD